MRVPVMTRPVDILRELRATLALAGPIIIGQVGQTLMGVTDSLMIGRIGKVPLAAAAFANGVCNFLYIAAVGLLLPVAVLTARAHGARDSRQCAEYLRHGLALAAGIAVLVVLLLVGLRARLEWFGQPPEVLAAVGPFFTLLTLSLIPAFFFQVLKQYAEALGHPWMPMAILLVCVALNAVGNWLLIYGHCGLPALGLAGSALATLLARLAACLGLWFWLARRTELHAERPGVPGNAPWFAPLEVERLREMLRIGVPAAGQWLFEVGAFTAAALMMGWLGTVPLAAHQIALSCASFAFMFPLGLSSATSVRVSKALGAGRRDTLRAIGFGALAGGLAIMSCFALLFGCGGEMIARAFTGEPEVIALATQLLVVAALFQLFDGAQVVGSGALRGLSDVRVPTLVTFLAYWVFALPGGYVLAFPLGLGGVGVWTGLALGLAFAALLLGWRFHRSTAQ